MSGIRTFRPGLRIRQQGSIVIPVVATLLVALILLGSANLGYLFYVKRDLQNAADLAALSGVQLISEGDSAVAACQAATAIATEEARRNFVGHGDLTEQELQVQCGWWDATGAQAQADLDYPVETYFSTSGPGGDFNALRVVIRREVWPILPWASISKASVQAVAKSAVPVAAFQIEPQLLRFSRTSVLGKVLEGVGLNIENLTVLDSSGVANATITPAGLLGALGLDVGLDGVGVLTPEGLATITQIDLLQLIDASASLVTDSTLVAQLNVLRNAMVSTALGAVKIPLVGSSDSPGLFTLLNIGRQDELDAALGLKLGLSDVLGTALLLGSSAESRTNGSALEVNLNLLGLVSAQVGVVEPPAIAIGPVGTTAYGAQVRAHVKVDSRGLPVVGPLLASLGTWVYLPLTLESVAASGELVGLACNQLEPSMDVAVTSSVLNVCLGEIDEGDLWSSSQSCAAHVDSGNFISLLGIGASVNQPPVALQVLAGNPELVEGLTIANSPYVTARNPLALGNTVDAVVLTVLNTVGALLSGNQNGTSNVEKAANYYLDASKNSLGLYDVDKVTKLVVQGELNPAATGTSDKYLIPPLLTEDFSFNNAIPTSCLLDICPVSLWKRGTFSQAFKAYTSDPGGLLGLLGLSLSSYSNGHPNCAGLLSALLAYNSCVKTNLVKLLQNHPSYVQNVNSSASPVAGLQCDGFLCFLLKPVLSALNPVLNGVGGLLSAALDNVLGLQIGRNEVKALSFQCSPAELVY